MSDAIYALFKRELSSLDPDQGDAYVPHPWGVRRTYTDQACLLVEHPRLPPLVLNKREAVALHNELVDPSSDVFAFVTGYGGHEVKTLHGARHVSIAVADQLVSMTHPVAADLAAVISRNISALGPLDA